MLNISRRQAMWLAAAVPLILQWSLPANASVTCFVRKRGTYVCTFFCRNGFICDNDNLRCLPGPALKKNLSDLQEKARVAKYENNKVQQRYARQANSQSTGYDLGSTYYIWNGDPREMPTPRHRQGGGFSPLPSGGYGSVRQSLQARLPTVRTPTVSTPSVSVPSITVPSPSSPSVTVPSVPGPTVRAPSPTVRTPSADTTAAPNGPRRYWEDPDYCATANSVERGSALYGYYCNPDQPSSASKDQDDYKPFPDPKDLDRKVSQICGPYSRETRQCFFENKLKIVLDTNPDIRAACANRLAGDNLRDRLANKLGGGDKDGDPNDNSYTRCIDDAYLHGLHPKSDGSLREALRQKLQNKDKSPDQTAANQNKDPVKRPPDKLPNDGCGPGRGLKPDPNAFGAWTCQALGGGLPGQDDKVARAQPDRGQDPGDALDPTMQELNDYLNMLNPNSGGNLRGDLGGRTFSWGSDDYRAIERLQQ